MPSSFRARTGILLLALTAWLPLLGPARGNAQEPPPTDVLPACTAASTNAETVPVDGNSHVTHWVTLDPYTGCNWHVEVVGGTGWISNVVVGSYSWRTVEFAASPNTTGAHRSATVRVLAGTAGNTQLTTFQVEQDPIPPACTGFGDIQLNNPNPPEGGGGWGALVPLYPNMDCQRWAVSAPSWIHISGVYNTLRNNQWYGHFFYTVDPNTAGAARSTNVMVYQPGTNAESPLAPVSQPPCTYGITGQPQQTLPGEGGTYTQMQVTTQTGCPSQPVQQPAWVHFPSPGTVFDYDRNGPAARAGQMAFGGQTVTIQQAPSSPETYRITSKAILPTSHITDPWPFGHRCDGGVDSPVADNPGVTWLRGDNHNRFDPAPDGAFSGLGLNGMADSRTFDQVEFTWDGSHFSNGVFNHNIIASHRDFTYRHGDLFFSCEESGQATGNQDGYFTYENGVGNVYLSSSVAVPPSLVPAAPNLDTFLHATIDVSHNLTVAWNEDPWTQGFRVDRKDQQGNWIPLEKYITSDVSCIDLYGAFGLEEASKRLFDPTPIYPFGRVLNNVTFNLPSITQTQPEYVWPAACVDRIGGHDWSREPCALHTLLPSLKEFSPAAQQSRSVLGAAWPSCAWNAQSDASWLTPQAPSGTGSGYVSYNLTANTTGECRYGSINYTTPGGSPARLSVTQLGLGTAAHWNAAADFRPEGLSNPSADCHGGPEVWEYMASARGVSRLTVDRLPIFHHDTDCSFASRSYWKPTSAGCQVGVGREGLGTRLFLTPSVDARAAVAWHNPGPAGYFNVAGNIHDEGGFGGHWYIDKGTTSVASGTLAGGITQPFNQTVLAGVGETILFTYEDDPAHRSEASVDLTITPTTNPACSLSSINPFDVYLDSNPHGGQTLTITATQAGCPFSAQSSDAANLAIAGADPQGRFYGVTGAGGVATLTYNVSANPEQYREMTILVTMGATTRLFTVHQNGADPCQVTDLNMYYQTVDSGAHTLDVVVTTTAANCPFTAARTQGGIWLSLPGGGATYNGMTGANRQATVRLTIAANQGGQRVGTIHFSPTQGQTVIELRITQRAYVPPNPCNQGWSSDSYIPDDLVFVGGAGGAVQFRVLPPAGCEYKAIERCGTYCTTNSPRLDSSLPSHVGAYVYNTHVPGLSCGGGNLTRTTYVDVKTTSDNQVRDTIVIFQTCASDSPGNPNADDKPVVQPAPDPDQWSNGACLPPREAPADAGSAATDATAPPTVEQQVDALAESLAKQYRERRAEILATSGDPKTDLEALEKDIAAQFEKGTIDIYAQANLASPFDPGCQPAPADAQPAQP
jgi:hypothetical protein